MSTKKYLLGLLEKEKENSANANDLTKEDIQTWINSDSAVFPSYLENKTLDSIRSEIIDVCFRDNIPTNNIVDKLREYRYVDKICDLNRGKFIRWIRVGDSSMLAKGNGVLTKGNGVLTKGNGGLTKGNGVLTKGNGVLAKDLVKGGIVADIKFLENGTYILVKNSLNRFIQYKYDECITFQKLSVEELLLLNCMEK